MLRAPHMGVFPSRRDAAAKLGTLGLRVVCVSYVLQSFSWPNHFVSAEKKEICI